MNTNLDYPTEFFDIKNDSISRVFSSLQNKITGLGQSGYDSLTALEVNESWIYNNSRHIFDSFYHSLWQVRKVVDLRAAQMAASWGEFALTEGDQDDITTVNKFISGLASRYERGQQLANKDGSAFLVRLVDDGILDYSEPINYAKIKSIRYSRPFDRWEIYPDPDSYNSNPYDPDYYLASINYSDRSLWKNNTPATPDGIIFQNNGQNQSYLKIHKSRVVRFNGNFSNEEAIRRNQGCFLSILPPFLSPLLRYLNAIGHVGEAMSSFEMIVYLIDNLYNMSDDCKNKNVLENKFRVLSQSMSSMRATVADRKQEDVQILSRNFSNVDKVLDELKNEAIGASDLDHIEMYQVHPTGMQATGQSERLEKALKVMRLCHSKWGNNLVGDPTDNTIGDLGLYILSDESPFDIKSVESLNSMGFSWIWNSAIALTPEEEANLRDKYSQLDERNIRSGIYTNLEARGRYTGIKFTPEITVDENINPEELKPQMQNNENEKNEDSKKENKKENKKDVKQDAIPKFKPKGLDNNVLQDDEYEAIISQIFND